MATELIVNASLPETRIALMENGEIQEILIERAQGKGIVGNIYKGRVTRVLPGMQAAFVDIGLEKAAFLYVDDVFVHSDIWKEEEGTPEEEGGEESGGEEAALAAGESAGEASGETSGESGEGSAADAHAHDGSEDVRDFSDEEAEDLEDEAEEALAQHPELLSEEDAEEEMAAHLEDDEDDEDDEGDPVGMGEDDENPPKDTVAPSKDDDYAEPDDHAEGDEDAGPAEEGSAGGGEAQAGAPGEGGQGAGSDRGDRGRRRRRGRRGGRNRRRGREEGGESTGGPRIQAAGTKENADNAEYPESYRQQVSEEGDVESDRSEMSAQGEASGSTAEEESNRPTGASVGPIRPAAAGDNKKSRPEFRENRGRDRKIKSKQSMRPSRMNVSIQDLLKEGQEVIVQIAKDPIATKGARLTCHISLPGRHLVCMPTIDHVGVSRRIEKDEERRRLREYVDRNRPKGLGFIVRTATSSGKTKAEARIKQDIDYLSALWSEIKSKANQVQAPALVYEDLNSILRAIRDWVNEDIDKIVVDSRYHYNDVQRFVRNFMPGIGSKIDLYQGDLPIFDTYGISTELARGLERKVWLKSGGYLVIDQAEALVSIDVNTGRYVGKKSLEDTILKTNLEAVKEIAYQLRLRNCGGIIILDLIDMEREDNKLRVYRALEEELAKDRSRPQISKISELGLVEMTRKRTRDTMVRALCDSCSQCEGKGYIKSKLTVAYEIMREIEREGISEDSPKLLIQAHPEVIDILAIDERESLDALEKRYKKQIYLQAVQDLHPEQYELIGDKRSRKSRSEEQLLERARELAQTNDPRRGRRRDRGRGKDRNRDRDGERKSGGRDRNRGENRHASDRPRISIRPGGAEGAPAEGGEHPNVYAHDNAGAGGESNGNVRPPMDENMSEEDRLAYLRAQAAQDAAIAGGGAQNQNRGPGRFGREGGQGGGNGAGGERGDRGGRRGRRGRRGGRGRFQRGTRGEGQSAGGPTPNSGGEGGGNGGGDSGGSSGDGGSGGGGGDHSNPPA
ncbi:MAG: Rne/Rng family ribonuclease [Bdellovibrionales bacterium]|nr:Rne/Rng family ribonuclease [Bdellovibrionales bacterium]